MANVAHHTCHTPGKLSFVTRREALDYFRTKRIKITRVYECKCGKYHTTRHKNINW